MYYLRTFNNCQDIFLFVEDLRGFSSLLKLVIFLSDIIFLFNSHPQLARHKQW